MNNQALYVLASGLVLDRQLLIAMNTGEMTDVINKIRAAGDQSVTIIPSAEGFFTQNKLIELIAHKDVSARLVNDHLKLFTPEQIQLLLGKVQPVKAGDVEHGDMIADIGKPIVGYAYAPVPPGWSIDHNMSLGPTKIKRKIKNADGDGTMFWMSPAAFEKLWLAASNVWYAKAGYASVGYFETGVGKKLTQVTVDHIMLGGNYIRRYEIEQIAKYRGWAMPMALAA